MGGRQSKEARETVLRAMEWFPKNLGAAAEGIQYTARGERGIYNFVRPEPRVSLVSPTNIKFIYEE